jgi:hypothetical protein
MPLKTTPNEIMMKGQIDQPPFVSKITGAQLRELRTTLGESLAVFGLTLKRAIDPKAERGYTRQYISRLENGQDVITREIEGAFWLIATTFDEVPTGVGSAVYVRVLAQPGQIPDGALIPRGTKTERCARPGCGVIFIKTNGRQKYHDPDCARLDRQRIRKLQQGDPSVKSRRTP